MAEKRKITRKVIAKPETVKTNKIVEQKETESPQEEIRTKRVCLFCQKKSAPSYTDLVTLRRYLTDRAKILPKAKSNICSRHQRAVAKNIKYARHLSLLPFVPKV